MSKRLFGKAGRPSLVLWLILALTMKDMKLSSVSESKTKNVKKSAKESGEPNIYRYTNYRAYLHDMYEFKKNGPRGYSYRSFSQAGGFSSPNILKLVIENKRNISTQAAHQFAAAFGLKGNQLEYFLALVGMNQADTDEEKSHFYQKISKLVPYAYKREISEESVNYLSHWLYPVLREMTLLDNFKEDPYWLVRRIVGETSPSQISSALGFLLREEFIKRDDSGALNPNEDIVISSDEIKSLAIRNYHRQMLQQAAFALENTPFTEREFGALTFVLPEESMPELKLKIKEFRKSIHQWAIEQAKNGGGDSVVQLNMQMYPHSKKAGGDNE